MTEHRDGKGNVAQDPKRAADAGNKAGEPSRDKAKSEPKKTAQPGQKQNRTKRS